MVNWKAKSGGVDVSDAKRLRALEDENVKLKKLLAEAMLDNAVLKDVASKKGDAAAARREMVAHAVAVHGTSERQACVTLGVDRSSCRYRSRRPADGPLRERLRALEQVRHRFGNVDGSCFCAERSSRNRVYRLYRDEGLERPAPKKPPPCRWNAGADPDCGSGKHAGGLHRRALR